MKHLSSLSLAVLSIAGLAGCQDDKGQDYVDAVEVASTGLSQIQINSNDEGIRAPNESAQWTATATLNSGTADYSAKAHWSSSEPEVATISSSGEITALRVGETQITAHFGPFRDSETFAVSDATLQSVNLNPASVLLDECKSSGVSATGVYSDGSTRNIDRLNKLSWTTADGTIASAVESSGAGVTVISHDSGNTTLTATFDSSVTQSTTVTVLDTLTSIALSPTTLGIEIGSTSSVEATGAYNDGGSANITKSSTWSSAEAAIATVSNTYASKGTVTGVAEGSATVSAGCGGIDAVENVAVTVTQVATLDNISFSVDVDPLVLLTTDTSESLVLMANYDNGESVDVSADATWSTIDGDTDYIFIGDSSSDKGDITFASNIDEIDEDKSVVIRASYEDLKAQITVKVAEPN